MNDRENAVEKSGDKPELHLMPGKGITVDMVGKMFKSITGKDMTAEDRANCEATLAAHIAQKKEAIKK